MSWSIENASRANKLFCDCQMQNDSNKVPPDVKARVDRVPQDLEEGGIALNEVHAFEHLDDHHYAFEPLSCF